MPKRSLNPGKFDPKQAEQLNRAVDAVFAGAASKAPRLDASVEPLAQIAAELRSLPREDFKARLKTELLKGRKTMTTVAEPVRSVRTTATPHITLKNATQAIEFYAKALGATETFRFEAGGRIAHAEIKIGDTLIGVSDEWPEGGRLSAETYGHSPVSFRIFVEDVDSFAARAVSAGMKVSAPITDQFYGYREGNFVDPFGYTWNIVTVKEVMPVEEMHRRLDAMGPGEMKPAENPVRAGFLTVTPYLVAADAESVIQFVKKTFGAEEMFRDVGSAGGYHCEVRIEDSMLMIGGGGAGLAWKGDAVLGAFHVYVRDCDAAYQRAIAAGGTSLQEPADQAYGERTANVRDAAGNYWYIATFKGDSGDYKSEGAPTVQPYLHPLRAEPVINFLKNAFGAEEMGRYTAPDGVMHHTTLKIGTSQLEMGEAQGVYQPMKPMFYLYVPQVDATYRRAITAGATSIHEPADQPYGDRVGAVKDVFGNQWWIATHMKEIKT
jgi:PhnB protein